MVLVLDGILCLGHHVQPERSISREFGLPSDVCLAEAAVTAGFYATEQEALDANVCVEDFYGASNTHNLDVLLVAGGGDAFEWIRVQEGADGSTITPDTEVYTGGGAGGVVYGSLEVEPGTSYMYLVGDRGGDNTETAGGPFIDQNGLTASRNTGTALSGTQSMAWIGPHFLYADGGGGGGYLEGVPGGSAGGTNSGTLIATTQSTFNPFYSPTFAGFGNRSINDTGGGAGGIASSGASGQPLTLQVNGVDYEVGQGGNPGNRRSDTTWGDGGGSAPENFGLPGHFIVGNGTATLENTRTFATESQTDFDQFYVTESGGLTHTIPAWDNVVPGSMGEYLINEQSGSAGSNSFWRDPALGYNNPTTTTIGNVIDRYPCGHLSDSSSTSVLTIAGNSSSFTITGTGTRPVRNGRLVIVSSTNTNIPAGHTTSYVTHTALALTADSHVPATWSMTFPHSIGDLGIHSGTIAGLTIRIDAQI